MKRPLLKVMVPLLALVGLLALPDSSQAQGIRFGGRGWSVGLGQPYYGGNWYGGYYGGYRYPGTYWSNSPYYGWSSSPYRYYGNRYYGTSSYNYPGNIYYQSQPAYYSSFDASNTSASTSRDYYQVAQADTSAAMNQPIHLRISVPENARLWIFDQETQLSGEERMFISPPMAPGKDYYYTIKAQWTENGQKVKREKRVTVHAGDFINIDFLRASDQAVQEEQSQQPPARTPRDTDTQVPESQMNPVEPNQPAPRR